MAKIYYTKPSITELEVEYATDAARNGWGEHCYDYIHRFEKAYREHLGCKYAIATSSCTGAMHMGLAALGIGRGDEVILADTNWIATVAPIVHLNATPVFVDILADSWCIDPDLAEAAITSRTRAIVVTHLYGNLCDMDRLLAIGEKYGIPIVEDAAEAIGSIYHGKSAGSLGRFGTFSFHGSKTITTGEGGMFVTDDADLFETVLTLSNHGRSRRQKKQFFPDMVGYKYKLSNVQAAIGCAQLERIDDLVQRKRDILACYKKHLGSFPAVTMNPEPEGTTNGSWMPTVVLDAAVNVHRDEIVAAYAKADIDARIFFWPLSSLGLFEAVKDNVNAWDISARGINLPSYHEINEADMDRVSDVIRHLLSESS